MPTENENIEVVTPPQELEITQSPLETRNGGRGTATPTTVTSPSESIVNTITVAEVKRLIAENNLLLLPKLGFQLKKVDQLPPSGSKGVIYLVAIEGGETPNLYEEYIWNADDNEFELLGTTEIDLSGYAPKSMFVTLTQTEYDNLQTVDPNTYYFIEEE